MNSKHYFTLQGWGFSAAAGMQRMQLACGQDAVCQVCSHAHEVGHDLGVAIKAQAQDLVVLHRAATHVQYHWDPDAVMGC